MGWDLVVLRAAKLMVCITIVSSSTPTRRKGELVIHWEAEFAKHAEGKGAVVEPMARVAARHCNEWVGSVGREDPREMAKMVVVVDADPGVEAIPSAAAAMLSDSIPGTFGGELLEEMALAVVSWVLG